MNVPQKNVNINVKLEDTEKLVCEECGKDKFVNCFSLRKVSALQSPTGQESLLTTGNMMVCIFCGAQGKLTDESKFKNKVDTDIRKQQFIKSEKV